MAKKFSERAQVSTGNVDTLDTMSTLSVLNRAHSENTSVSLNESGDPAGPCPSCGSGQWWQDGNTWHCRTCTPNMPLVATILTVRHATRYKRDLCAILHAYAAWLRLHAVA